MQKTPLTDAPDFTFSIQELSDLQAEIELLETRLAEAKQRSVQLRGLLASAQQLYGITIPLNASDDARKFLEVSGKGHKPLRHAWVHGGTTFKVADVGVSQQPEEPSLLAKALERAPIQVTLPADSVKTSEAIPVVQLSTREAAETALNIFGKTDEGLDIHELEDRMRQLGWATTSDKPTNVVRTMALRLVKEAGPYHQPERGRYGKDRFYGMTDEAIDDYMREQEPDDHLPF